MIITITCNPAIDKTISNNNTVFDVGGKGINVSKVLNVLDVPSLLTGFLGKDNKDIVLDALIDYETDFVLVDGLVRTNTKRIINNELYEENENGPYIDDKYLEELKNKLSKYHNEIVVISGSIPTNVKETYYQELVELLKKNNNYVILDASKKQLKNAIKAKPNVIKPNKDEICELFNIEYDEEIIIQKCKELIRDGIETIIISLGSNGSLFINKDSTYKVEAIKANYKSALGAGDAMVAGLAYGISNKLPYEEIIKLCVALATASVETEGSKPPCLTRVNNLINSVIMKKK